MQVYGGKHISWNMTYKISDYNDWRNSLVVKTLCFHFRGTRFDFWWGTKISYALVQFISVQLLSRVRLFAIPWIVACQASLSITNSRSSLRLMSIELLMPSSHLILCRPLLLLPPIPPSIKVFSNESTLRMRWPKYWSFTYTKINLN